MQILPVVLDPEWILTDQVLLETFHDCFHRFRVTPVGGLSQTADTIVGVDL